MIKQQVEAAQIRFNPHPSRRTGATCPLASRRTRTWFQSSPVPKDGCNAIMDLIASRGRRFNPHPSRRTGATLDWMDRRTPEKVSILTRPEGRVQQHLHAQLVVALQSFNPHPSRRTGATDEPTALQEFDRVSILTRPEGRVQRGIARGGSGL